MSRPLLVSTPTVEGYPPARIFGDLSANAVWEAAHLAERRFKEAWDNGRYGVYKAIMDQLEKDVIRDLSEQARALGANAIVGFSIHYGTAPLLQGSGAVFMQCAGDRWYAHAEGTAVFIDGIPPPQP